MLSSVSEGTFTPPILHLRSQSLWMDTECWKRKAEFCTLHFFIQITFKFIENWGLKKGGIQPEELQ